VRALVAGEGRPVARLIKKGLVSKRDAAELAQHGAEAHRLNEQLGLRELVRMVLERLCPLADSRRLVVNLESGDDGPLQPDSARLLHALRPGSLHATQETPTGEKFEVSLSTTEGSACLILAATPQSVEAKPLAECVPTGERESSLMTVDLQTSSDPLVELVADNLRQLGQPSHGAFLQELLRGLTSVEVSEKESLVHWEKILARRNELAEKLRRPSSLRTAAVDYFSEIHLLRKPILLEYEELEKLRHSAATDPLTGLKNRRMFEESLAREINRSTRYGTSFALLLLDLRRFKLANDTYGHATGDEILRRVARASMETVRGSDISCRIGGDEFAILISQADRASAQALAERIVRKFEGYAKPLAPSTPVGIDYGIAVFPEDGEEATKLFQTADRKLYERKQGASRG